MRLKKIDKPYVVGGIAGAILATSALLLSGCNLGSDDANKKDVLNVEGIKPEKLEVFINVDGHPNVALLCIHHVAWVTTTRAGEALRRAPEYDVPVCGGVESKWLPVRPDVQVTFQQAG
jgi:hypothetical protein